MLLQATHPVANTNDNQSNNVVYTHFHEPGRLSWTTKDLAACPAVVRGTNDLTDL